MLKRHCRLGFRLVEAAIPDVNDSLFILWNGLLIVLLLPSRYAVFHPTINSLESNLVIYTAAKYCGFSLSRPFREKVETEIWHRRFCPSRTLYGGAYLEREWQVTSPTGAKMTTIFANEGQKFEFQAHQRGLYKFCFNNPGPTPETISFHIHVGHIPGIADLAKDGTFLNLSISPIAIQG